MKLCTKELTRGLGEIAPSENEIALDEMMDSLGGGLRDPYLEDGASSPMAVRVRSPIDIKSKLRGDVLLFF
jgi:hypothetical protein